jgi:Tfp pilus assembly protein PilF
MSSSINDLISARIKDIELILQQQEGNSSSLHLKLELASLYFEFEDYNKVTSLLLPILNINPFLPIVYGLIALSYYKLNELGLSRQFFDLGFDFFQEEFFSCIIEYLQPKD